jgi:hypothetical protein
VGSTSIHVPLADNGEFNRCFRLNLSRTIHEGARILAIANSDSNRSRIECDWPDVLIPYLADEDDSVIGRESMHFLDGSNHVAVIADIRNFALFIALVQLW